MTQPAKFVCRDCPFQSNNNEESWTHKSYNNHRFFREFSPTEPAIVETRVYPNSNPSFENTTEVAGLGSPPAPNTIVVPSSMVDRSLQEIEAKTEQQKLLKQFAAVEATLSKSLVDMQKEVGPIPDSVAVCVLLDMARGFCEWNKLDFAKFINDQIKNYQGETSFFYAVLSGLKKEPESGNTGTHSPKQD